LALALLAGTPALGQAVLEIESSTLTAYKPTGATTGQGVRPLVANRGVHLDGTARLPSLQGWMLAGNPFGERWDSSLFLGEVRLDLGAYTPTEVDLALPAQVPWIIGRSYNGQQDNSGHYDSDGYQGKNWYQMSQPELHFFAGATNDLDVITIVYGADRYIEFKRIALNGTEFKSKNGAAGVIQYVSGTPDTYVYYDQRGMKTTFFGNNTSSNRANWQIWKIEDPAGNVAYVGDATTASTAASSGYDASARVQVAYDSADRRYTYTYSTLDSVVRLTQVKAETKTGGTWASPSGVATVGQVDYGYYQSGGTTYGDAGNLKTVTQTIPLSDSGVNQTRKKLYRYWVGAYNSSTNPGYANTLQYVVDFEGYRAADWAGDSTFDDDPLTMSEANLKPYVKAYFEYDGSYRIRSAFFDGECGCSGGNNGTYSFVYGTSGYTNTSAYDTETIDGVTTGAWAKDTIVARPDGAYVTQFFDEAGQPLSRVLTAFNPSLTDSGNQWSTQVFRDSTGVVSLIRTPKATGAYTASTTSFATGASNGLAQPKTVSGVTNLGGLPAASKSKDGKSGSEYLGSSQDLTSQSLTVGATAVVRPLIDSSWVYTQDSTTTSATGSAAPGSYKTGRSYTFWTGAAALMPQRITTTYPTVTTGNNGSNSATTDDRYLRKDGTTAFSVTTDGIFTYTQYTNGQLVKRIQDAQTNHGSDFASGDDPNTDFGVTETGSGLRLITTYTYDAQGRPDTTTMPDGRVTKMYYSKLADGRMVTLSIPRYVTGSPDTFYGPCSYTVANQAGKVEMQGTVALSSTTTALSSWIDETDADPITALDVGTLASMKTNVYNTPGTRVTESRAYFTLPASGAGSAGTNYDPTVYGYDDMGRTRRVKSAAGTITRTTYDAIGRRSGTWIGTNDHLNSTFPDSDRESSGTDNMVETERLVYDGGTDKGNSLVTSRKVDADGNWAGSTDQRETTYAYDYRDRVVLTVNPQSPHVVNAYDTMNRVVGTATYSSSSGLSASSVPTGATNRLGYNETFYDQKGQVYKTTRHKIDASDGSDDDSIDTLRWYDPTGRLVKVKGDGQHAKYRYDRVGKQTHVFALATDNDSGYSDVYTGGTTDVAGDIVLQETQTTYEDTSGLAVMRAVISRLHDDLSTGTTGALDGNGDSNAFKYTAANVAGRIQITAMWYDALDRLEDTVQYGTYGGSDFDRKPSGSWLTVPSRSSTALRTTNVYNTDGTLQSVTDPKAYVTRYEYDALFRQTKVIKNYTDGTPGGGTHDDQDQTVKYEYANGLRTKITADLPSGTDQDTIYIYGTTAGTPSQMKVSTGHLLRAVKYPDTTNTGTVSTDIDSDSSDVVSYAYNALGEQVYMKDQLGSVIETDLDTGGRQTQRRVTTLGSGLDNAVLRIATTYTSRGQVEKVTQYSNATVGSGSVVDDVKYVYDDWGNVTNFKQDVDSDLDISPANQASFEVTYSYSNASPTNGATRVRRTGMTGPGNASQTFEYQSAHNMIDDAASRVSDIMVSSTVVVEYQYNGVAQVVGTTLDEPNFYSWQYSTGGAYPDLDRFDRVIKSKWTKGNGSPQNFVDLDITYDDDSAITRVEDNILVTTGGTAKFDSEYTNDALNRLIQAKQGNWNGSLINNTTQDERWLGTGGASSLDQVGNWGRYRLDLDGDGVFTGAGELDDTRTHNVVNELTGRDTDTSGSDNYTLAYDADGNMTDNGKDAKYVYDAFGRLRQVKSQSNAVVSEYRYNGLGYRISWHYDTDIDADVDGSDATFYFCHDDRWRIVATVRGGDTDAKEGFVWHNAGLGGTGSSSYIDAVVLRDRDANTAWASAADGVREERLYYLQNWRADVSLVASSGAVLRGYTKYSAYGVPYALFAGDVDLSGSANVLDFNAYLNMINMSQYAPYADLDTDGDVDFGDTSFFDGGTGGRGVLSSPTVNNRLGYTGYQHAPELAGTKWHVRHRVLDSEIGRWIVRDAPDLSEISEYEYCATAPIAMLDPEGLDPQYQPGYPTFAWVDCATNCTTVDTTQARIGIIRVTYSGFCPSLCAPSKAELAEKESNAWSFRHFVQTPCVPQNGIACECSGSIVSNNQIYFTGTFLATLPCCSGLCTVSYTYSVGVLQSTTSRHCRMLARNGWIIIV
jgi:RHS repeat-associated protein